MVSIEDVITGSGPERRVDNHKLVLFLMQLKEQIDEIDSRFAEHMKKEEIAQKQLGELIVLLTKAKGGVGFIKILIYVGGPLLAFITWAKAHIHF